ncbi:MAG: hypothetical protein SGILL_007901, partial [Bacillariaceae sp.]
PPALVEQKTVGILLMDHGSKKEASNARLQTMAQLYQSSMDEKQYNDQASAAASKVVVKAAHMEIATPSIPDGLQALLDAGVDEIVCHPFFLSPDGRHVKEDIPEIIDGAVKSLDIQVPVITTAPVGSNVDLMLSPHLSETLSLLALRRNASFNKAMKMTPAALPRIGLGMAALGRPGYINLNRGAIFGDDRSVERMQSQADLVLDALFRVCSGSESMPWIDCARSYGLSEKFTGEYLKKHNIKPDEVYVSSKWGYTYCADFKVTLEKDAPHEVKDHTVANFLKQVKETEELIGDYVNLYQIHSATFESGVMDNKEVHKALHQCRQNRGWAIGLSVSSPKQDEVIPFGVQLEGRDNSRDFEKGFKSLARNHGKDKDGQ